LCLRPHIEAAFERPHVTIDFAGFSGETLRDALAEVLDKVRAGRLAPESIAIRVLVSDTAAPMTLPARAAVITCMPGILPDHPQQTEAPPGQPIRGLTPTNTATKPGEASEPLRRDGLSQLL